MSDIIKIKKGHNINLKGKAEKIYTKEEPAEYYAVKPTDFHGVFPKLIVHPEQTVKAGSPLFFDKKIPEIHFTSPVNGTITEITRGERRTILEIIIKRSCGEIEYENFRIGNPLEMSKEEIKEVMLASGLWPSIRQRPYDIIANPDGTPKSIFISAFDSAPLAPDIDFLVKDYSSQFQAGVNALSKFTNGKIHVNINAEYPASEVFTKTKNIQLNRFLGPHPSGNVGVQIHHIDPINKGELVWFVSPQDVITIGRLFLKGIYDASKIIALAGSEIVRPRYHRIVNGASIKNLMKDNSKGGKLRYISGNVLTGKTIASNGFLGFYDSQVTVIPEGDYFEFMGWAKPGFKKYSISRSFWSWLCARKEYVIDTNLKGGSRTYVMTGQYENVFPMNIFPVQLIKAILIEDIDLMEKLGIYEIAPEDFALCEFVCTSKTNVQSIIRKGLDLIIKEMK